jgi:hypothetical protein
MFPHIEFLLTAMSWIVNAKFYPAREWFSSIVTIEGL